MAFIFCCDDSFDGLLTAVYQSYYHQPRPDDIVCRRDYQPGLFDELVEITTNASLAERVLTAIHKRISAHAVQYAYYAYLSEHPGINGWIYRYLQLGFRLGRQVDAFLTDEAVRMVHDCSALTGTESHRLKGLIRFQLLQRGIYYAPVEPDCQVLELLAYHFARRLSDQNWIIHDQRRERAVICNCGQWIMTELPRDFRGQYADDEQHFQQLWRTYFDHAAIANRKNPKLQRRCMPARYWKHLVEQPQ